MSLIILRTDANHPDFITLVKSLDSYLKITDGEEHDFYNQFNAISVLKHTVVAYKNNIAVGCGAFKIFKNNSIEIKRMFMQPDFRAQGIAAEILKTLETWAHELGYKSSVLETGIRQVEAVQFYKKCGYKIIPNYGQYINMKNSLCFKKELN